MLKKIIFSILFLSSVSLSAQEVYDLKRCLSTGLERNYEIRMARNEQRVTDNNATLGNAGALPTVDLAAGFNGSNSDTYYKVAADGSELENTGIATSNLNAGINLNWTIFDGFNIHTNYKRLKEMQQMGELQTSLAIENYTAEVAANYYNLVQQQIRLQNMRAALQLSRERMNIVEAHYSIGSKSRLDWQQAKVDFNADSSALMRQQELLNSSRIKLNQLMALENPETLVLVADSVIDFNFLFNKDEIWQKTLSTNTFIKLSEKEKTLSLLDLKSAQSENYPYVRLNTGYGYNYYNFNSGTYKTQNQFELRYGVTVGFNIFNGLNTRRKAQNARLQIENKELGFKQLELSLKSDFSNLWMAYQNNLQIINLETENLQTAHDYYDTSLDRFKLGDLSGVELREAQISLREAEERLVQAQYNIKLCEISLQQISGGIGEYLK
jgi:outer membrane protein TolC